MKKTFLWTLTAAVALMGFGVSYAADEAVDGQEQKESKSVKAKKAEELSPVAKAVKKLSTFNGKPNLSAKYYIYLESASWCGPCRKEMPEIVEAYETMKERGVELILISHDHSKKEAKAYVHEFEAKFPVHFNKDIGKVSLPGFRPSSSVPHATIVTADGKKVTSGHGSLACRYKACIAEYEEAHSSAEGEKNASDSAKDE